MGFSFDPGPLPFCTVRQSKWGSRLIPGDYVQIQGEHGCAMPKTPAKVLAVMPHRGLPPDHLAHIRGYSRADNLYDIYLGPASLSADVLKRNYGFPV